MHFGFSDEQLAIQETTRRFAQERLAPHYMEREKQAALDMSAVKEMAELGLLGVNAPVEFGGMDTDCVTAGIVMEEIAKADINYAFMQLMTSSIGVLLAKLAPPEITNEFVPKLLAGETLLCMGLTEPGGGSDAANLQTKAIKDGDYYVLNGEKTSISLAAQSEKGIIFARTGEGGARGVTGFFIDMNQDGVTTTTFDDVGCIPIGRGSIFMDNVRVHKSQMLGDAEGKGFYQIMNAFDLSRTLIGLQALAPAISSVQETWDYASEREAFGKKIGTNQGVSFPLAEAETFMEAAKTLCYKTLWLRDNDMPHTAEAAMCKWWPPEVAFQAIHQCIIINGHFAYSKELPHQQRLRDVMGYHIGDGTRQIQKLVIAREKGGFYTLGR